MKSLITSLILASSLLAQAADPVVVITNSSNVTVDGASWGKPADVIANNPALAPAVQRALEAWAADMEAAKKQSDDELAALRVRITTVLNDMLAEELKSGDGPRAALLRDLIAQSQKSDAQVKAEALAAEIAAKQAELAKLQGN